MKESKASKHFTSIPMKGVYNKVLSELTPDDCSQRLIEKKEHFLTGSQICTGIPFDLGKENDKNVLLLNCKSKPISLTPESPLSCRYLVFLHGADFNTPETDKDGIPLHGKGNPILGDVVAEYVIHYMDGTCISTPIKRRLQISEFAFTWGNESFLCVPHEKPKLIPNNTEMITKGRPEEAFFWGGSQGRVQSRGRASILTHWLYALENPNPEKQIKSIEFIPLSGKVFIFGLSVTNLTTHPLLWEPEKRLKFTRQEFNEQLLDIDLGAIVSITPVNIYDNNNWSDSIINEPPIHSEDSFIIEYTAHTDACIYYDNVSIYNVNVGASIARPHEINTPNVGPSIARPHEINTPNVGSSIARPNKINTPNVGASIARPNKINTPDVGPSIARPQDNTETVGAHPQTPDAIKINEPSIKVNIKTIDKDSKPVPVKLHIHGPHGEYLPPMDRHRYPNPYWFEDYSVDYTTKNHFASYINGDTQVMLPIGDVYIEVTKGFEIRPVKQKHTITPDTKEIIIQIELVLPWRQKGWISADTHVHFLSPQTAQLEGNAEGVNVVNLLASQWGELFTNVGDFDGSTTIGSVENGGDGEHLVRVGTENRQPVLGHISLLGYDGSIILPLTSGGPNESRLGDAVETSLSIWAKQCHEQNGINILPHFPMPYGEGAASIVLDLINGVEIMSWDYFAMGISPYSIADWYKYLNCGFHVPAAGGTDKMSASTPVGGIRTYTLIKDALFTYESWKSSMRSGLTFVTIGPLVEFLVNGVDPGNKIEFSKGGGTLDINWQVSSLLIPVTRVQIVCNGEVVDETTITSKQTDYYGKCSIPIKESGWIALRVFGQYPEYPEIIAAHTSAIMINVDCKPIFKFVDAMAILEQIEGATAYIKTLAPKKDERQFAEILSNLTAAHRKLHNMMHKNNIYHDHSHEHSHHDD